MNRISFDKQIQNATYAFNAFFGYDKSFEQRCKEYAKLYVAANVGSDLPASVSSDDSLHEAIIANVIDVMMSPQSNSVQIYICVQSVDEYAILKQKMMTVMDLAIRNDFAKLVGGTTLTFEQLKESYNLSISEYKATLTFGFNQTKIHFNKFTNFREHVTNAKFFGLKQQMYLSTVTPSFVAGRMGDGTITETGQAAVCKLYEDISKLTTLNEHYKAKLLTTKEPTQ